MPTLKTLSEVHEYAQQKVSGWCSRAEGDIYYSLAKAADGPVVELGVFHGKSLLYFAAANNKEKNGPVIGIDTFAGVPGTGYDKYMGHPVATMYDTCRANLEGAGLFDNVLLVKGTTLPPITILRKLGLLFIDANHAFEAVYQDFEAWYPMVADGAHILLHDVVTNEGPAKVFRANLIAGRIAVPNIVGFCGVAIKTGQGHVPTNADYHQANQGLREWAKGTW